MEMIDLFVQRGMERADAQVVIMRMAKYKQFFLNIMMMEELCLPVPGPCILPVDTIAHAPCTLHLHLSHIVAAHYRTSASGTYAA